MKKLIALILAALMIVSLTGCIEITVTPVPGNEEAEPAEEPAAEEELEQFREQDDAEQEDLEP